MSQRFRTIGLVLVLSFVVAMAAPLFAQQTASQFYMSYRAAFDKAMTMEELLPYMAKDARAQMEATPAADRPKMFGMLKMVAKVTDLKILKETKNADGSATLTVEGLDPDKKKATGTIEIMKEDGAWKLGKESWSASS
jgi:hypothetical protein